MWMGRIGLTLLFSLQGVKDLGTTNARYGGKSSKSVLEIFPTASDHQAVYGCRATNLMIPQSEHDAITLNVLCKFINITSCELNHACMSSADFFSKLFCSKISSRNTIGVSNSLDPDQARHFVWADLCPNCWQM